LHCQICGITVVLLLALSRQYPAAFRIVPSA
jgi:hypothetical protein